MNNELRALRGNRKATPANFKKLYERLEILERQRLINAIKHRRTTRPRNLVRRGIVVRTIQRYARGFITRRRLNNPTWGKPSYANVVRTGNTRPLGQRFVEMKLFKNLHF
jgi:hypothetical protein